MKPNTELNEILLDNADQFHGEFFERFALRQAATPLTLTDGVSKRYFFPTFYTDVTCAIAIFFCNYDRARALMPHPSVKPVNMLQGRSLVVFSCYEYKKVRNMAPYNEIAMSIPVLVNPSMNVPILPMLGNLFGNFGYSVFSMPVTSLENEIRGHSFWGLPKVLQEIEVVEKGGNCVTIACDASGEPYFELRVPVDGKETSFDVTSYLYSQRGSDFLRSKTQFKGTFNVQQYPQVLFRKNIQPEVPYLRLGSSSAASTLAALEIEPHPFQCRFTRQMNSCFDLPDPAYRAPFAF